MDAMTATVTYVVFRISYFVSRRGGASMSDVE